MKIMGWITKRIKIPDRKYPKALRKEDISKKNIQSKINLDDAKKLHERKKKKPPVEFLIDENVLGIDRYLSSYDIKFRKVGDPDCPPLGSDDPIVAKFALQNKMVVVTNDDKLLKQCEALDVSCVCMDLRDLAKKVKGYADTH